MIRRATAADADRLAALFLRSWDAALPTVARAHPDSACAPYWPWVIREHEGWTTEDLAGVLVLHDGWIEQLYLEPDRQGAGLGDAFVALAQQRCPDGLQLWTFQVNGPARRFYERHGFVAAELTDGSANEEHEPDVRYVWRPAGA